LSAILRALPAAVLFTLLTLTSFQAAADVDAGKPPEISSEYFVEEHDGFRLAYHPAARERVREIAPLLGSMREQLSHAIGQPVLDKLEIRVAALPIEVARLAPHHLTLPMRGGVSFPDRGLIVVSLGDTEQSSSDLEASLRYHLARVALESTDAETPAWFAEGFAAHFAADGDLSRLWQLELATLTGDPPSLGELDDARPGERTRALAADFIRFISKERTRMPSVFAGLRRGLPFDRALEDAFGSDASTIERAWRRDALHRYGVYPLLGLFMVLALSGLLVRHLRRRRRLRKPSTARHILRLRSRLRAKRQETKLRVPMHLADHALPRVEHDGNWHTLH